MTEALRVADLRLAEPPPAAAEPVASRPPERAAGETSLDDPALYFNRELSWLKFNERVLEEALDENNPLLERVNFLSIFGSNLDEFYMIRVSGLRRQMATGVVGAPPDGMSPSDQLAAIRQQVLPLLDTSSQCWKRDLEPKLREAGIKILSYDELKGRQRRLLRHHFKSEIFPVLTPLAFDPGHPFPHISNLSMNLAVVVQDPAEGEKFARLRVPQTVPRLLRIPEEEKADSYEKLGLAEVKTPYFIWVEEVIAANLDLLFPGLPVVAAHPFRVTRDADLEIEEDEASDLMKAMEDVVGQRHFGLAVRLEIDEAMPARIREILTHNLGLAPFQVFVTAKPIGLADLSQLTGVERPALKYPPFQPVVPPGLGTEDKIFATLKRRGNVLLYHPYDSFAPVVTMLQQAARDPNVLAIKQTLYRVGPNSPIVEALKEARENGKQVSALVELKARFDEQNNIVWAQALERAGVHVVYGVMGLKTHAKICLVVRREAKGLQRYVHLSTGNYNPATARVYTDFGYFTCDPAIADDVSDLFNALTGYSRKSEYGKLLVAPWQMREGILARIEREIEIHRAQGGGAIAFKMNALVDRACIQALYRASQAGVKVELQVRGICCLRPGVPGVSDNIRVTSIVGRFLEHSRIYYFRNGGDEEVLAGSADLMPRNLGGRVEVLFPIADPRLRLAVVDGILRLHLADTKQARLILPDGSNSRVTPAEGEPASSSQEWLLERGGAWRAEE